MERGMFTHARLALTSIPHPSSARALLTPEGSYHSYPPRGPRHHSTAHRHPFSPFPRPDEAALRRDRVNGE
jgi:hypothetical protein